MKPLLVWKNSKCYISVRVCVCVCACLHVRACGYQGAWACVGTYVYVALLIQHATRMRHIVTSVAPRFPLNFSTSHKRCDFQKKSY
jgi:hypothetical protein